MASEKSVGTKALLEPAVIGYEGKPLRETKGPTP